MMVGTYSPMTSLMVVQYYLLARCLEIMKKRRDELATNPSAVTAFQLEQLSYFSAVVQEAHRLAFWPYKPEHTLMPR